MLCFLLLCLAVYAEEILDYISSQPCTSRRHWISTIICHHRLSHFEGRRHGPPEGIWDKYHPEIIWPFAQICKKQVWHGFLKPSEFIQLRRVCTGWQNPTSLTLARRNAWPLSLIQSPQLKSCNLLEVSNTCSFPCAFFYLMLKESERNSIPPERRSIWPNTPSPKCPTTSVWRTAHDSASLL